MRGKFFIFEIIPKSTKIIVKIADLKYEYYILSYRWYNVIIYIY